MEKKEKLIETQVGISQIGVAIPKHYISVEKIAEIRGLKPGYASAGLGGLQARIPFDTSIEDLIVEAVKQIDYKDARRFYLGTESDPDMSKPLAIKAINGKLGLRILPFQFKLACLGGLQAVWAACEYSIAHRGKPAIVIAADRSFYNENQPDAEVTEGCAAVAMRIEMNPSLLLLDYLNAGQYAEDIDDFYVPFNSAPFPEVNGPLSKPTYLEIQKNALEDWKTQNQNLKESMIEYLDYFVVHVPFIKMVHWHMAMFWHHEHRKERKDNISLKDCIKDTNLFSGYKRIIDDIRKLPEFQRFFNQKVKPGLLYNSRIGNSYTGSIFVSLIALLEQIKKGQLLGMSGYGSGAGSITMLGQSTQSGFKSSLEEQINQGTELTIEEYESWRAKTLEAFR